jgi:hypothetical protein
MNTAETLSAGMSRQPLPASYVNDISPLMFADALIAIGEKVVNLRSDRDNERAMRSRLEAQLWEQDSQYIKRRAETINEIQALKATIEKLTAEIAACNEDNARVSRRHSFAFEFICGQGLKAQWMRFLKRQQRQPKP